MPLDDVDLVVGSVQGEARGAAGRPSSQRAHHPIADLLGQAPEARQLGARDGENAAVFLLDDRVLPGDVGGARPLLEREGPHAGVGVGDLLGAHAGTGQDASDLLEQVGHLVAGGMHPIEIALEVGVRGAHQRELPPGDDEDHPVVGRAVVEGAVREAREQTVNPLGPPHDARPSVGDARPRAELIDPRARGIDDDARAQGDHACR